MKIRKSKQFWTCSKKSTKHASTWKIHKSEMVYDKWMGLKPWQSLGCLVISCKISCPSNKVWAFHKWNGNMYHTKSTFWSNRGENLKQMENAMNNSTKNHIQTRHTRVGSCKNSIHFEVTRHGYENQQVAHQWCDTNCHTLLQKFITHNPDKINSQTLHQNHHECV
jgi:hypothetical protein